MKLRPVDLAVFQIKQVNLADRRLLIAQRVLGVFSPIISGADNDAVAKRFLAGCGEKAIDVLFL